MPLDRVTTSNMLAPGVRLGTYEVLESLGVGGMGEVFRARDARLGRDVALKVLSGPFKLDSVRFARFEREARVLASLNHPNIAALHAIEPFGETHALVLEFVDGETLCERIARGALPRVEALPIAQQIAAALEAAHEQGVIHRDLKPSNVKVRADGTVKLLDFGLAKVCDPLAPGSDPRAITLTIDAAAQGAVVGTPAYMSPEQARGMPVDKRTDIWAFGCVLYELLTGRPVFTGERASDVLARIIEREPDFTALPRDVPPAIRRLVERCLTKDARDRLRDIGDARLELAEAIAAADGNEPQARPEAFAWRRVAWPLVLVSILAAVAIGFGVRFGMRPAAEPASTPSVSRFALPVSVVQNATGRGLAISPDGARLAFTSQKGLYLRSRERLDAVSLIGLSGPGAGAPFFSPDGQWVGFTDGQTLRKVPISGGPAVMIAAVGPAAIANWSTDGIVFADMHGLFRVAPTGGSPVSLAKLALHEQAMFPQLLPGGGAVLYTVIASRSNTPASLVEAPGTRIDVLNLTNGHRRTLVHGGGHAQYVPTGHLIYVREQTLYAAAFDPERLEMQSEAVPMVTEVSLSEFAVSDEGTLAFQSGVSPRENLLVWVDRQGREEPIDAPPRPYVYPRLSPDGTRIALDVGGPPDRDVWIWHLRRKTLERFTHDPAGNPLLAWSRDGRRLAFGSDRFGVTNLFWQAADGSGEPERLLVHDRIQMPMEFAPDGRLLFSEDVAGNGRDIHALSLDGTHRVQRILYGPANDTNASVSPDGRWVVYDSDESGQYEVYVRPYPNAYAGGRWQISSGGGRQPRWSRDGKEIYLRDFEGAMLAARVELSPTFAPGPVQRLFANSGYQGSGTSASARTYDLSTDGQRFLMLKSRPTATPASEPSIVVVLNWFQELKRAVPRAGP